ncbi:MULTISPECIES: Rieske 2Fe-2S domain-containing protein [unclassified Bradyrhizobium]
MFADFGTGKASDVCERPTHIRTIRVLLPPRVRSGRRALSLCRLAGEPIVVVRLRQGDLFAREDRCARRQVPLSKSVVRDCRLHCCYRGAPRQLPSLSPANRANPTARANSGLDKT